MGTDYQERWGELVALASYLNGIWIKKKFSVTSYRVLAHQEQLWVSPVCCRL